MAAASPGAQNYCRAPTVVSHSGTPPEPPPPPPNGSRRRARPTCRGAGFPVWTTGCLRSRRRCTELLPPPLPPAACRSTAARAISKRTAAVLGRVASVRALLLSIAGHRRRGNRLLCRLPSPAVAGYAAHLASASRGEERKEKQIRKEESKRAGKKIKERRTNTESGPHRDPNSLIPRIQ
ncbi:hypothetical protein E2562_029809 [Oryza meyeriana var. granulata]|uniref:Uncharacterized protein n=1 Tax=Oryza meyeriana var. granulata TaxID=110450 RepID=A0A6G1CKG3_9ORYZ|nr:hypothetical protein E2562_029809 [Oryza meyeriana var. granulata]